MKSILQIYISLDVSLLSCGLVSSKSCLRDVRAGSSSQTRDPNTVCESAAHPSHRVRMQYHADTKDRRALSCSNSKL